MCLSSLEEIGNLREGYMWVSYGARLGYGLTVLGIRLTLQSDTGYIFSVYQLKVLCADEDPVFRGRRRNDLHCRR